MGGRSVVPMFVQPPAVARVFHGGFSRAPALLLAWRGSLVYATALKRWIGNIWPR